VRVFRIATLLVYVARVAFSTTARLTRTLRLQGFVFGVLGLCVVWPRALAAHEVPRRVAVQMFVRPDGRVVRVLVRVPIEAMRDVMMPLTDAGFLDLARADSALREAAQLWVADGISLFANGQALPKGTIAAVRGSLPSDHAFDSFTSALTSITGAPLDVATRIPAPQAMLDVLLQYPLGTADASTDVRLAIEPRLAHLGVQTSTVLRLVLPSGAERAFVYDGDPGLVQLEPRWWYAVSRFVGMGVGHLFSGVDHLLFLLCLILPMRRLRPLIGIVTAFTVAHSITLTAAALGFGPSALWFPPLVELLIAASIVFMAVENVIGANTERRWMVAFGFGLIHGFGFSYALGESLQFAGAHLALALAAFNVGIELAQLLAIAAAVPVISWVIRRVVAERPGIIIVSVMVAHTAWHWMTERFEVVRAYRLVWPAFDTGLAISGIRFVMGLLIIGGVAWAISGVMTRLASPRTRDSLLAVALVAGMIGATLSLATAAPLAAQPSVAKRSTMSGVYTAAQANKGKQVFAGSCSGCHTVASHSGDVFWAKWMGRPLADFFNYVSGLMPKSAPATLTEDEYVWVTAYVLRLNGMPPGTKELEAEPAMLKAIRIDTSLSVGTRSGDREGKGAHIR